MWCEICSCWKSKRINRKSNFITRQHRFPIHISSIFFDENDKRFMRKRSLESSFKHRTLIAYWIGKLDRYGSRSYKLTKNKNRRRSQKKRWTFPLVWVVARVYLAFVQLIATERLAKYDKILKFISYRMDWNSPFSAHSLIWHSNRNAIIVVISAKFHLFFIHRHSAPIVFLLCDSSASTTQLTLTQRQRRTKIWNETR